MATPHRLRPHVGGFRSVLDAAFAPMDDENLAVYVAYRLAAGGQEAFYRQIRRNDPATRTTRGASTGVIERPALVLWDEGGPVDTAGEGRSVRTPV